MTIRGGGDTQTLLAVIKKIELFALTDSEDAKTSGVSNHDYCLHSRPLLTPFITSDLVEFPLPNILYLWRQRIVVVFLQ